MTMKQTFENSLKLKTLSRWSEEQLFSLVGEIAFQLETYGNYQPNRLRMEKECIQQGKVLFNHYVELIQGALCPDWHHLHQSDLVAASVNEVVLVLGMLLALKVPLMLALPVATLMAKRGLDQFCR